MFNILFSFSPCHSVSNTTLIWVIPTVTVSFFYYCNYVLSKTTLHNMSSFFLQVKIWRKKIEGNFVNVSRSLISSYKFHYFIVNRRGSSRTKLLMRKTRIVQLSRYTLHVLLFVRRRNGISRTRGNAQDKESLEGPRNVWRKRFDKETNIIVIKLKYNFQSIV